MGRGKAYEPHEWSAAQAARPLTLTLSPDGGEGTDAGHFSEALIVSCEDCEGGEGRYERLE